MATHKSLVLVGMMGTGKSTIGKEVAKKLKIEFIDTDTLIENEENLTIAEIFKKNGEKYFRELEEKIFLKIKNDKENIKFIYFGYGTATLDSLYKPYQLQADEVMRSKGYNNKNWITKEFPSEDHSENAWRKRLHIPITFLLGW